MFSAMNTSHVYAQKATDYGCSIQLETRDADQRICTSPMPVRASQSAVQALVNTGGQSSSNVAETSNAATAGITATQLQNLATHFSDVEAEQWSAALNDAMHRAAINTPARRAAFLAQVLIETEYFKWTSEAGWIADESTRLNALKPFYGSFAVCPREDILTGAGAQGPNYYGRGLLMLTGREQYAACSRYLFNRELLADVVTSPETLVTRPHLVAQNPKLGIAAAVWQFTVQNNCNTLADELTIDAFQKITLNLKSHRRQFDRRKEAYQTVLGLLQFNVAAGESLEKIGMADVSSLNDLLAALRQPPARERTNITSSRTDWIQGTKMTTTWVRPIDHSAVI